MVRRPTVLVTLLGLLASVLIGVLAPVAARATPGTAGTFTSVAPTRLLDTRSGLGGRTPAANGTVHLQVLGAGPVPSSGVSAVILNVTVTAPAANGFVTVWADGAPRPGASNLNFRAGQTVPNLVVAPVGSNGRVALFNGSAGSAQLVADVAGYYASGTATAPGTFTPVAPARLLDTRSSLGGATPAANGTVHLQVTGRGGVPATGVAAVVLNVTVTAPVANGYVTVSGDGGPRPGVSNLNFVAGQTVPDLVVTPVGDAGGVALYNGSAGRAQLVADVAGYFLAGTASAPGAFVPVTPARLLNTRSALGGATPGPHGTVDLQVTGRGGVPTDNVAAVVLTVTVTGPKADGYVTAYAGGASRPGASNLNFRTGQTVPNLVVAPVGTDGQVSLYNGSAGTTQLVADVAGYYLSAPVGGIGGTITRAGDGARVAHATVVVHDPGGTPVASTSTASDGTYRVGSLAPGDYVVCVDGGSAPGGPYLDECWADQPWDGFSAPPTGTTPVPVVAGATSPVSLALASTQGIAGTVTASGTGLPGVAVRVFDGSGTQVGTATTGTGGAYSVALDTGTYTVCFDATGTTGGPSATGYRSQCYHGIAWPGGTADVPDGTTPVDVLAGSTHGGVNAALAAGGAVTGRVASGSDGLTGVVVTAFDDLGDVAGTATTAAGAYTLPGLDPGDYTLCFDGTGATGGSSAGGYLSQCAGAIAWVAATGLPADAASITTVLAGQVATLGALLTPGGGLSGTVTGGGSGVAGALVTAFDTAGNVAGTGVTDATGAYRLGGLPAGSYRVCADSRPAAGVPATGWVDQCYGGILWDAASALPALGTLPLSAVVGALVAHADLRLAAGARLSGTITETGTSTGLGDVEVSVLSGRTVVAQAATGPSGAYSLTGVPAGTYTLCFDATFATGGSSPTGSYASECWNAVAWDTDPADVPLLATPVVVLAGAVRTGLGAVLDDA